MSPILRNILAVIAGYIVGSISNMGLIMLNGIVIETPEGFDSTSMEAIQATAHLLEPQYFIFPFLGHAVGTFIGALMTAKIAANNARNLALLIGALFFAGGVANIFLIPAPLWFNIADLALAYFPMAYFGWIVSGRND
ncbi:MAG: hypothetical protein AAGH79_10980 [Bacteroidota bacterium]